MPFIYQMTVIRFNKPNETESDEGYFPPDRFSLIAQVTIKEGGRQCTTLRPCYLFS